MTETTWDLMQKAILRACEKMEPTLANMIEDALIKHKEEKENKK